MFIKATDEEINQNMQDNLKIFEKNLLYALETENIKNLSHKQKSEKSEKINEQKLSALDNQVQHGVFDNVEEAIDAAYNAQKRFIKNCSLENRSQIISALRRTVLKNSKMLARLVHEETKLGRYEDKIAKHMLVASKTPGIEDLTTAAFSGDSGLTILEYAPVGLIGAVTPITNPTETVINNSISILSAGNAIVFNVHPSSKKVCSLAIDLLNRTIKEVVGIENLVTMVRNPSMGTLSKIMDSPYVKMLVGTGGKDMVKTLLRSGKKAIGAGAGNPPVIVDETADLEQAAKDIIQGASFDNNILCIAEKEVFVMEKAANSLISNMLKNGAYLLDKKQVEQIMGFAMESEQKSGTNYHISKEWIGKDASLFLKNIGVTPSPEVRLLIFEADFDHPFVHLEQMMPILPIVKVKDIDEAFTYAIKAEQGNRHTAMMYSRDITRLTNFSKAIDTTIFIKNASSLAGIGVGGEGYTTMTIAGPTGEGLTSAKTFTRIRKCVFTKSAS